MVFVDVSPGAVAQKVKLALSGASVVPVSGDEPLYRVEWSDGSYDIEFVPFVLEMAEAHADAFGMPGIATIFLNRCVMAQAGSSGESLADVFDNFNDFTGDLYESELIRRAVFGAFEREMSCLSDYVKEATSV